MTTPPVSRSIRNLKLTSDLFEFAYEVKKHQLRVKHPEFDEKQLHEEAMRLIREAGK